MKCPICQYTIDPNDNHSVKIGNSFFDDHCLSDRRKEAEQKNQVLTFLWTEEEYCSSVYLAPKTSWSHF